MCRLDPSCPVGFASVTQRVWPGEEGECAGKCSTPKMNASNAGVERRLGRRAQLPNHSCRHPTHLWKRPVGSMAWAMHSGLDCTECSAIGKESRLHNYDDYVLRMKQSPAQGKQLLGGIRLLVVRARPRDRRCRPRGARRKPPLLRCDAVR